jgi:hypothetical protein
VILVSALIPVEISFPLISWVYERGAKHLFAAGVVLFIASRLIALYGSAVKAGLLLSAGRPCVSARVGRPTRLRRVWASGGRYTDAAPTAVVVANGTISEGVVHADSRCAADRRAAAESRGGRGESRARQISSDPEHTIRLTARSTTVTSFADFELRPHCVIVGSAPSSPGGRETRPGSRSNGRGRTCGATKNTRAVFGTRRRDR